MTHFLDLNVYNAFLDRMHDIFLDLDLVHNTFLDLNLNMVHNTILDLNLVHNTLAYVVHDQRSGSKCTMFEERP